MYVIEVPAATSTDNAAVAATISAPRIGTYQAAVSGDLATAVALYGWNARISTALMLPAHFAEVAVRNVVDDALTVVYGPRWPWEPTFVRSLPNHTGPFYSPKSDLLSVRGREPTTGKVIAELKFVFWQNMFTARHDIRVWDAQINTLLPGATSTPQQTRLRVYNDLEVIRKLRNRIAHHEPIFRRNLYDDLARMLDLVDLRSSPTGIWVRAMQDASTVLAQRP